MDKAGALIRELRRMGSDGREAARYMGLCPVAVPGPTFFVGFAVSITGGVLLYASESEWALWAGVATCLSVDLGLCATDGDIYAAAAAMCKKSCTISVSKIG